MIKMTEKLHKLTADFAVKAAADNCHKACALVLYQEKLPENLSERLEAIKNK